MEFQQFYVFTELASPAQVVVLSVIILRLRVRTEVFVEDQVIYLHVGEFSSVIYTCTLPPLEHIMDPTFLETNIRLFVKQGEEIWKINV